MKTLWLICAVLTLASSNFRERNSADQVLRAIYNRPLLQWALDNSKDVETVVRVKQIEQELRLTKSDQDIKAVEPKVWPWIDCMPALCDGPGLAPHAFIQEWMSKGEYDEKTMPDQYPAYRAATKAFVREMMENGHWDREEAVRQLQAAAEREAAWREEQRTNRWNSVD